MTRARLSNMIPEPKAQKVNLTLKAIPDIL